MNVERAQWVLTEAPGPEVTKVLDYEDDIWVRRGEVWLLDDDPNVMADWPELLVDYGPLTDASPVGEA